MSGTTTALTLGIVDLYFGSTKIPIEPGGTFKMGGLANEAVIVGRAVRRSQKMIGSEIDVTSVVQAGVSVLALYGAGEQEAQVHCDTGQIFSIPDAFIVDRPEFSGEGGGKLKLKLMGGNATELL